MRQALPLLLLLLCAAPVMAIDRVTIQAGQIEVSAGTAGNVGARDVTATLTLPDAGGSRIDITAASLQLPAMVLEHTGAVTGLRLRCDNPVIREPDFGCPAFDVRLQAALLPPLRVRGRAALQSGTGRIEASGELPQIAGSTLRFDLQNDARGLRATLALPEVDIAELRTLLGNRLPLPAEFALSGRSSFTAKLAQSDSRTDARLEMDLADVSFQNDAATWIGEKLALRLAADVDVTATPLAFNVEVSGRGGQFLGGPVLLDFNVNPLEAQASGSANARALRIASFTLTQKDLATVRGSVDASLDPVRLDQAEIELEELVFPAAYTSYMQLLLATTPFNQLVTRGKARGRVVVGNNLPTAADLEIDSLTFHDDSRELRVEAVTGALHWTAGLTGPPRPSFLAWESSRGWGIEGGRTRLDFATHDRDFQLLKPARLPFFDGALVINTLTAENLGLENLGGVFDAIIEPISLQPLSKAMGWPEFSGQLSGRIPGLTYKDQMLTLAGNVEADVFDGRVVASNLRVREPLGAWPRLFADVTARNLDLELITSTFEFGSITGRLDIDLTGLETFNWSPTAFDLKMATPRGDRSRHRISQKAVQNLSNIGGGGGGVAAALQSGALQFFEDFGYDRIGLSCRLRNDICQMDGVGKIGTGYYIVKGSGLPRINIIGNENRVDWPRLLSQLGTALANTDSIVVN